MFDFREYYAEQNEPIETDYKQRLLTLNDIFYTLKGGFFVGDQAKYNPYFKAVVERVLQMATLERELSPAYFSEHDFAELKAKHDQWYAAYRPQNYKTSCYNPAYAVQQFGSSLGQILAMIYAVSVSCKAFAFEHRRFDLNQACRLVIRTFAHIKDNPTPDTQVLTDYFRGYRLQGLAQHNMDNVRQRYSPAFRFMQDIVCDTDLNDLRYLFRYGRFISENEIDTARFLNRLADAELAQLARTIIQAYWKSFERQKKDKTQRKTVDIRSRIGYERIIRPLVHELNDQGYNTVVHLQSTSANKQAEHDYRFAISLILDDTFVEQMLTHRESAIEACQADIQNMSGQVYFYTFGEPPFAPIKKKEAFQLSEDQLTLYKSLERQIVNLTFKYAPRSETSFTAISFPLPEIGPQFESIFKEMVHINTLDADYYERIQQKLIDVLDTATYVHVKGAGPNQTDIKVQLQPLPEADREAKTLFVNAGADMNIPVGEVFTSPQLVDTKGVLHFRSLQLSGLDFKDLRLTLKDGYVTDYSCQNFSDPKENQKYIEENLLFPHKTLPLGEFAIGTNTFAYMMAKRYDILDVLPILLIEKMGPHFAIGDTCFCMQEDQKFFNVVDHKEMVARENEKSALRKTTPDEAYTFRHTDMTLPYESIAFITAVRADGTRQDIIRDGRFVIPGTEPLNEPFDASESNTH